MGNDFTQNMMHYNKNDHFRERLALFKKYKSLRNFLSELSEKHSDSLDDDIKQELLACLKRKDLVLELDKIFFKKNDSLLLKRIIELYFLL